MLTTRNPGSEDDIDRYVALLDKETRTKTEEAELRHLGERLQEGLLGCENDLERKIEKAELIAIREGKRLYTMAARAVLDELQPVFAPLFGSI